MSKSTEKFGEVDPLRDIMRSAFDYRPHPKSIQAEIQMGSDDGSIREIQLNPAELVGAW